MKIKIVSDVHEKTEEFSKILENSKDHVLQLGDLGIGQRDVSKNKFDNLFCEHGWSFIQGNHDNPYHCEKSPHFLGRFGCDQVLKMFWVSGGYSPRNRDDWWRKEQLTKQEMNECLDLYQKTLPKVMITHSAPMIIAKDLGFPDYSFTKEFLEKLFWLHKPDLWIFGHYHKSFKRNFKGTQFVCLDKLEEMTIDV